MSLWVAVRLRKYFLTGTSLLAYLQYSTVYLINCNKYPFSNTNTLYQNNKTVTFVICTVLVLFLQCDLPMQSIPKISVNIVAAGTLGSESMPKRAVEVSTLDAISS